MSFTSAPALPTPAASAAASSTTQTIAVGQINIVTNPDTTYSLQAISQDGKTIITLPGQQEVLNWLSKCVTTI